LLFSALGICFQDTNHPTPQAMRALVLTYCRIPKLLLLAAISSTAAAASSDQAAIEAVESKQAAAWNAHDAAAYADLFTPDGDVVNVVGWWWKGREEIRSKLTDAFALVFKDSRLTITDVQVRKLSSDVAVAHVRWTMTGALPPPGEPAPPQGGIQLQVLVRSEDGWRIASFQNTNSRAERPFPKAGELQPAAPAARSQPVGAYQSLSVQDFATDGVKLAAASAKVSMTGAYILQGDRGMLYADVQAIIKMRYGPKAGIQPSVPLLTNAASDQFRRRVLACQTDPSASEVGCTVKIRGRATLCTVTIASGDTREAPCVNVEDGK
jgi:uncharacterized protein (TIGR02246 family)